MLQVITYQQTTQGVTDKIHGVGLVCTARVNLFRDLVQDMLRSLAKRIVTNAFDVITGFPQAVSKRPHGRVASTEAM